jgi:hypothetical protein
MLRRANGGGVQAGLRLLATLPLTRRSAVENQAHNACGDWPVCGADTTRSIILSETTSNLIRRRCRRHRGMLCDTDNTKRRIRDIVRIH